MILKHSSVFVLTLIPVIAFGQATITGTYLPGSIADSGGTGTTGYPYAVFVTIAGWTAGASSQAYVKFYNGTNNEFMWSASGTWSNSTTYGSSNQPVVNIDGSGNWSGWIYMKHNPNVTATGKLRAAKVGSTSTNLTSVSITFNVLSMTSSGGWLVRQTSPAVNKPILAYSGGTVVGSYRTEDNGISEGYAYGAGGFKIAVPAGQVDSLVTFNDNGSRDALFVGPWAITAGFETDASVGGGQFGKGTASLSPAIISGGVSHSDLVLTLRGETPDTITNSMILAPSSWSWSHNASDLEITSPGSPVAAVSGDSITLSGVIITGSDSLTIRFLNLTPADSTARFTFMTRTGKSADSLFLLSAQPSVYVYSIPRPISLVKENDANGNSLLTNTLVTVRGIVTVANEFGSPSYIQDNSGGLAVYGPSFSTAVHVGDEVIVSGLVQPFHGLTEIVNPILHSVVSTGNIVQPLTVTMSQIAADGQGGVEQYECLLVRVNAVTISPPGTWAADQNFSMTDASGTDTIRIDGNTNLVGQPIPGGSFDVVAIVGQYVAGAPYIGGYQLMPRSTSDIIASGPIIATQPVESNITPTSFTISWSTIDSGTTNFRIGKTPSFELWTYGGAALSKSHVVAPSGLDPATVYYFGAFSTKGTDTSFAAPIIVSTASPASCTGVMNVYFNHSVDTSLAWSHPAHGNWDLVSQIVSRIDGAQRSVDAALYSLSGASQGDVIAQALARAKNRGVSVRVICEHDNRNTSSFANISFVGIPLIDDAFDPVNAGAGLMHNKFFIIDGRGGAPDSAWVWSGSWNPTQPGTVDDYQNSIEIQDQALAGAYTLEFNEMWGSATDTPNASLSRFGARKTDNTPHHFVIGGRPVESYFSPSDRTTSHIVSTLGGAQHSVAFDVLTFTRWDLADTIVARKNAGVAVRGLMDNNTDTGNQFSFLVGQGIDVHLKTGSGLLHHKYAIVDAEAPAWDPVTVTGSHNWSNSAENSNNENTLIIRDWDVANQYLQEFAARYYQFGGTDSITVGVGASVQIPRVYALEQNFPNPFNPTTVVSYQLPAVSDVRLVVYDILGREVAVLVNGREAPGTHQARFDAGGRASGMYMYRLEARRQDGGERYVQTRKMILLK